MVIMMKKFVSFMISFTLFVSLFATSPLVASPIVAFAESGGADIVYDPGGINKNTTMHRNIANPVPTSTQMNLVSIVDRDTTIDKKVIEIVDKEFENGLTGARLDLNYTVNAPSAGSYVMTINSTAPYGMPWVSSWEVSVNGTKYEQNSGLIAGGNGADIYNNTASVALTKGENNITFHIGYGTERKKTFFMMTSIDFVSRTTDFKPSEIAEKIGGWAGGEALELHAPNLTPTDKRFFEMKVNAPKAGTYKFQSVSSQLDNGYISQYSITVNGTTFSRDALQNNVNGSPAVNPSGFCRNFEYITYLDKGENTIRYDFTPDQQKTDRILFYLDKFTFTYQPGSLRLEGESFINPGDVFSAPGAGVYKEHKDFSAGKIFFVFKDKTSMNEREIKYKFFAPNTGTYDMGFLCGVLAEGDYLSYGTDMDIGVNGRRYALLGHSKRTDGNVGTDVLPMFYYIFNEDVQLQKGWNDISVYAKKRPTKDDIHFLLDYIEFNPKNVIADYNIDNVKFNTVVNTPTVGENTVAFDVYNTTDSTTISPNAVLAVYRDGKIASVTTNTSVTATANARTNIRFEPVNLAIGDQVKIMLWAKNSNEPYCKPYTKNVEAVAPVVNVSEKGNIAKFTVTVDNGGNRDVLYDVKDYYNNTVKSGTVKVAQGQTAVDIDLGTEMPVGWYNIEGEGIKNHFFPLCRNFLKEL